MLMQGLDQALSEVGQALGQRWPDRIAVALSGGPDSSALAICTAKLASVSQVQVCFFHVHHGLMPQADEWTEKVRDLSRLLGVRLIERFVSVDLTGNVGVEAAARYARLQALQEMAGEQGVKAVLLAHHLNDQAETVLQRLLRGSGVLGLGAMRSATRMASLDAHPNHDCWWVRPWLGVPRSVILDCVRDFEAATGWKRVEDPSNLDTQFARGVIRTQLAEPLRRHWPNWMQNLARYAELAQEASVLLSEYGAILLDKVSESGDADAAQAAFGESPGKRVSSRVIDLKRWRELTGPQQSLALRTWMELSGARMPTQRRLAELCKQLNQVHALGHDRLLHWKQNDCEIRCLRGKIYLQVTIYGFGRAS